MNRKYDHLTVHHAEIEARCCQCDRLNVLRIADAFEVHNLIVRFHDAMIKENWDHDYAGNWFCPDCNGLI